MRPDYLKISQDIILLGARKKRLRKETHLKRGCIAKDCGNLFHIYIYA